jgi:transposase
MSGNSVAKWRERFRSKRLNGLAYEPRPCVARKVTHDRVVDIITRTPDAPPPDATRWTTRAMEIAGVSKATISRIWTTFELQSYSPETFKLSVDLQFVERVRDIVGLYLNPPGHVLVLCLDETSEVHGLDRTRPLLPMEPGTRVDTWSLTRLVDATGLARLMHDVFPAGGLQRRRGVSAELSVTIG